MAYCTVAQVKEHLVGVDLTPLGNAAAIDAACQAEADRATEWCDAKAGRSFAAAASSTKTYDGTGTEVLWIDDLLSLTSWTLDGVAQVNADLYLYPNNATPKCWARRRGGAPFLRGEQGNVTITGSWGYAASTPAAVAASCARKAAAGILLRLAPQGGYGATRVTQGNLILGIEGGIYQADLARLEQEAALGMEPYLRIGL